MTTVKSIEEKGFVMDLGSPNIFGFLPFIESHLSPSECSVGQPILCLVKEPVTSEDSRTVQLTEKFINIHDNNAISCVSSKVIAQSNQILPGCKIVGTVDKICTGGLYLKFDKEGKSVVLF